jgi:hypothetical protein
LFDFVPFCSLSFPFCPFLSLFDQKQPCFSPENEVLMILTPRQKALSFSQIRSYIVLTLIALVSLIFNKPQIQLFSFFLDTVFSH